jgi:hypothetical protein
MAAISAAAAGTPGRVVERGTYGADSGTGDGVNVDGDSVEGASAAGWPVAV